MHVEFIANSVRCLAVEVLHLHDGLETSQIEFCLPAPAVERNGQSRRREFINFIQVKELNHSGGNVRLGGPNE